jgi:hypothetical protein
MFGLIFISQEAEKPHTHSSKVPTANHSANPVKILELATSAF